jgi:hypothetical protein
MERLLLPRGLSIGLDLGIRKLRKTLAADKVGDLFDLFCKLSSEGRFVQSGELECEAHILVFLKDFRRSSCAQTDPLESAKLLAAMALCAVFLGHLDFVPRVSLNNSVRPACVTFDAQKVLMFGLASSSHHLRTENSGVASDHSFWQAFALRFKDFA